jgi:hypothetical protein
MARAEDASSWNLLLGDAIVDTLDVPLATALDAGRWVLLRDHWVIEPVVAPSTRLVSQWKPVHHPLVHMVTGDARVRVAVGMRAIDEWRTEVTVQGGVATEANLTGSPVLALARTAGHRECQSYVEEVRARLADERVARADAPARRAATPATSGMPGR